MSKPLLIALLTAAMLSACAAPEPEIVVVTATLEPPTAVPEVPPTNTPAPTAPPQPTLLPTNAPEPTPPPSAGNIWARNYLGSVESAGVTLEVVRVLVADVPAMDELWGGWDAAVESMWRPELWENAEGAFEVIVRLTNNGSEPVEMRFDCSDSNVQIGSYQVLLQDASQGIGSYANMCFETLWPQASVFSGFWAPLVNLSPTDVTDMTLRIEPPTPVDGYDELGPWLIIDIDLSDHRWEEIPDELR